jgi:hypothetical protein
MAMLPTFYPAFSPTSSIVTSPTVIPVAIQFILPKGAENWSASGNSPQGKKSWAVERSTIRRVSFEREKCWNRLDLVGFHGIFQWISWDVVRFFVRFHGLTVMYFMGLNGIMINQRTGHGSSWAMAAMLQLC